MVELAQQLATLAEDSPEVHAGEVEVRGPSKAPLPRIRGRFRYRVLLRGPRPELRAVACAVKRAREAVGRDVRVRAARRLHGFAS